MRFIRLITFEAKVDSNKKLCAKLFGRIGEMNKLTFVLRYKLQNIIFGDLSMDCMCVGSN